MPSSFLGKLRLCTWQILFLLFFVPVQSWLQQSELLTLNMKSVTLKQFVEAVQTQSGYSFLYKDNQLNANQRITVSAKKQSIDVVLEQAFKGKGISFMENNAGWHGKAPKDSELQAAMEELK